MQPLPRDFLSQIARKYDLTVEQEEAFVELYSRNKEQTEIYQSLNLSRTAFSNRMTGVYKKLSIGGIVRKANRLHDFLLKEYQKSHNGNIPNFSVENEIDIDELIKIIRGKVKADIQSRCGKMQVLDMTQAIGLDDIYMIKNT